MKKTLLTIGLGMMLATAVAQPAYITKSAAGTTAATLYFVPGASEQARLVGVIGTSDKAASVFSLTTGTTPQSINYSNAAGTNITLMATNGLAANDVLVIVGRNGVTNATIHSFANTTNVNLTSTVGWSTLPGDQVYKMGTATTIKCGAATTVYQGEAIYVGARGRPVRVALDGTSACSLDAVTARYE